MVNSALTCIPFYQASARAGMAAWLAAAALGLAACAGGPVHDSMALAPLSNERIAQILASPDRSAADRTNDLRRKPPQLLGFIGPRGAAV